MARHLRHERLDDVRSDAMAEHIHTHSTRLRRSDGAEYEARVYGAARSDGTWVGWIEFHALLEAGPVLRTRQETSQPDRRALEYWAGGLEPVYLDGALGRAVRNRTLSQTDAPPPSP